MSIQSILNKIIGIADNGLNTAAEMRSLLNEMVVDFSGSGATTTSELINDGDDGINPYININDVYGGNVVIDANYYHLQNYDYYTQANKWVINNTLFDTFISGTTTLPVAHATLDRIDVIAIESGLTEPDFVVISGTAATIPSKPEVDETTQVELTFVLVEANTTSPSNVFTTQIYDENLGTGNGEWDTSKVEEIPLSNTIDLASSATTAYSGSTTIRFNNSTSGDHVHFDNNILIDGTNISNLIFRIKVVEPQQQGAETLSFSVRFYSNSGPDGSTVWVTSGSYGFDATKLNVWQTIIIPSTLLGISSKFIDRIRLTNRRNNVEFFIDIVSIPVVPTQTSDLTNDGEDGINPYISNLDLPASALIFSPTGNTSGIIISGRTEANYGDVGVNSTDSSYNPSPSATRGATGNYSTASGYGTTASGNYSMAWGDFTTASNYGTTAFGRNTTASGYYGTAFGRNSTASGDYSTAFGYNSTASGYYSTVFGGRDNTASSLGETVIGTYSTTGNTVGNPSSWIAEDRIFNVGNGIVGNPSDAFTIYKDGRIEAPSLAVSGITGNTQLITKEYGDTNYSGGSGALIFSPIGNTTGIIISGRTEANYGDVGSSAIDLSNSIATSSTRGATGNYSTALGYGTTASGVWATVMGYNTIASGVFSTAIGSSSQATGNTSTTIGNLTIAGGDYSFAGGYGTTVNGDYSTGLGRDLVVSGDYSFAGGNNNNISGNYSAVFGSGNIISNSNSAVFGSSNIATGTSWTFISGSQSIATGQGSTSIGVSVKSYGHHSTAIGRSVNAESFGEISLGLYSTEYTGGTTTSWVGTDRLFNIGNGTGVGSRSDALTIYKDGRIEAQGPIGTVNIETGTTYTLALTDVNDIVTLDNGSSVTLTVPPNSATTFSLRSEIVLINKGAGTVTITAGVGVTINQNIGGLTMATHDVRTIRKIGTNLWSVGY
jgi:hypothetical protein